jgi:hypothetical protein
MISIRTGIFIAILSVLLYANFPSFSSTLETRFRRQSTAQTTTFISEETTTSAEPVVTPIIAIEPIRPPRRDSTSQLSPAPPTKSNSLFDAINTPITWLILSVIALIVIAIFILIICALRHKLYLADVQAGIIYDIEPENEWVGDPVPRYKNKGSPESDGLCAGLFNG